MPLLRWVAYLLATGLKRSTRLQVRV